jgi:hypothetical protein
MYVPSWLITGEITRLPVVTMLCWLVFWLAFAADAGYFIIRVLTAKNLDPLQQLFWLMALQSAAPIAAPIYWWRHIRPKVHG